MGAFDFPPSKLSIDSLKRADSGYFFQNVASGGSAFQSAVSMAALDPATLLRQVGPVLSAGDAPIESLTAEIPIQNYRWPHR